jgi:hypothetical protein
MVCLAGDSDSKTRLGLSAASLKTCAAGVKAKGRAGWQHNLEAGHEPPGFSGRYAIQSASGQFGCVRPESDRAVAGPRNVGWEADERPEPRSLGLLPSGPDPVGEWLVHRQPPAHLYRPRTTGKQARPDSVRWSDLLALANPCDSERHAICADDGPVLRLGRSARWSYRSRYPGRPLRSSVTKTTVGNRRRSIQAVVRLLVSPSSRRMGQLARPREHR